MPMPPEMERIATLEAEMRNIKGDVADIKISLKALEIIAQRGNGSLRTALIIGGFAGWLAGFVATIFALFHKAT